MWKTIGILAHVDAGKTTFSEQILYHANELREKGRVDHQSSFLDSHEIEKERGITIYADQASFSWNNSTITFIDTPGHIDFSPEMERSIQIMDGAILIISAVDGIQGHTETVWNLLRKHQIPTYLFINKVDREEEDLSRVLQELELELTENMFNHAWLHEDGTMSEEGIECIAERDETILQMYIEEGYDQDEWLHTYKWLVQSGQLFPFGSGSALNDQGIVPFMNHVESCLETSFNYEGSFVGRVYKIRHDNNRNRYTYIKALAGTLKIRDEVQLPDGRGEKITQLLTVQGNKLEPVASVQAGQLFAVTGLTEYQPGDTIGNITKQMTLDSVPTLQAKVITGNEVHVKELLEVFTLLDEEEPSLHVEWNEYFQEMYVRVMGRIQLEVLEKVVEERFGYQVSFGNPEILYRETIRSAVTGYGHFEPLRHYAEVHLHMEPNQSGGAITFRSECHTNDLSVSYQNLIEQYVLEQDHHGLLIGAPLTDVKCTLTIGRAHKEHTAGGDFKEAVHRAIRQGLEKADNVLLEPYYHFTVKVQQDLIGRILSDVQQASGSFDSPETVGEYVHVQGKVPVATFMDYPSRFASLTSGKGILTLTFSGYEPCHNKEEIIERIAYNKDADPLYTSSSIFCAKGKGYSVPWDEVEQMMHCQLK
ncbi:MAG TPA: translation factor GTPase family protein [Bacillota bacterium]|nr:translation factor GTPase family protein [Bacillota bacterium]